MNLPPLPPTDRKNAKGELRGERTNMNRPLPEHLRYALELICASSGEDIGYALGHLHRSTAFAYMSKLKGLGLAYTYCSSRGCTEVWPTRTGTDLIHKGAAERKLTSEM